MKAFQKPAFGLKDLNKGILTFCLFIYSFILKAQQELPKPEIDINVEEKTSWYGSWWVWAIGIAIFIIIIVAITNRGGRRD